MYQIKASLTKENIFRRVSPYEIFKRYCPNIEKLGKPFKSPFREDKHPSAHIIFYGGEFIFKDFGGETLKVIDFVSKIHHLPFRETLLKINEDFNLGLDGSDKEYKEEDFILYVPVEKDKTIIEVKKREIQEYDLKYWADFGITKRTLELFKVFPISYFSINGYSFKAEKYSYSYDYYWENGIFRRKIYQPFSESNKWFSNGGNVVQGEGMLPKNGDLLIITSSLKDVMTLYCLGYTAIAPTSELSFVPEKYFEKQNSRFKRIILFMDSDETGIARNKELSLKWNLQYINIPNEYNKKDISDFVRYYNTGMAIELLEDLL